MEENRTLKKEEEKDMKGLKLTCRYASLCSPVFLNFSDLDTEKILDASKERKFFPYYQKISQITGERTFSKNVVSFYWGTKILSPRIPVSLMHNYMVMEDAIKTFRDDKEKMVLSHASCMVIPAVIEELEKETALVNCKALDVKENQFVFQDRNGIRVKIIFDDDYRIGDLVSLHQSFIVEKISPYQYNSLIVLTDKILKIFNEPSK